MRGEGMVIACDVRDRRMALLRRTVQATGAANVRLVQADILMPLPFQRRFDMRARGRACSGLGTLRRDPDIRWRREEADLPALAAAQRRMLAARRRGRRTRRPRWSTRPVRASLKRTKRIADAFLAGRAAFHAGRCPHAFIRQLPSEVVDARGHLRTEPDRHGLEAFFGAVFERGGSRTSVAISV